MILDIKDQLLVCGLFFFVVSFPAWAEDLLLLDDAYESQELLEGEEALLFDDEFLMESETGLIKNDSGRYSFLSDVFSLSVVRQVSYGKEIEQSSMGARIELDTPLWSGAYARVDYRADLYFSPDLLAKTYGESYSHRELNEAWLQLSYSDCVVKLGKQTLFWGRVEGAYALDLISPLDSTKTLLTDFSDIRLASEMALLRCYYGGFTSEVFYQSDTKHNRLSHFKSPVLSLVDKQLGDEWGSRLSISNEVYDLSFNFAQLYTNQFSLVTDKSSLMQSPYSHKYELYGASLGIPSGSFMFEMDLAHKTKQVASKYGAYGVPEKFESAIDVAFGFEYLSPSNHQFNGGVWRFKSLALGQNKTEYSEVWNLTWSKSYLNEILDLSVLLNWFSQSDTAGLNLSSDYDVNDNVQVSVSTSYSSREGEGVSVGSAAKFRSFLKLEAQF